MLRSMLVFDVMPARMPIGGKLTGVVDDVVGLAEVGEFLRVGRMSMMCMNSA